MKYTYSADLTFAMKDARKIEVRCKKRKKGRNIVIKI